VAVHNIEILEVTIRTLCDVRAGKVADGVYLYSQTKDNQGSVLSVARQVINGGLAKKVLITRSIPKCGYPGNSVWEKELTKMGIHHGNLSTIEPGVTGGLNTLIEAEALIKFARMNKYRVIYITAAPFHQLRAFMTSVTATLEHYPDLCIYSFNGHPLSWIGTAAHSQGTVSGSRKELIKEELDRIRKYQKKGDLASDVDVLKYLDERDERSL
jgi:hypothetical protein